MPDWLDQDARDSAPRDTAPRDTAPRSPKILVVDYPNAERASTVLALAELGYTDVVQARDAPEAFGVLGGGGVDLILTEYHLRMMPGLVFVQNVRRQLPAIPILLVTGQTLATIFDAALDAGVNDTLRKPFSAADLGRKLDLLLRAPRSDG